MNTSETIRVGRALITPEIAELIADLQQNRGMAEMYRSHILDVVSETIMDPGRDGHDTAQAILDRLRALHMLAADIAILSDPGRRADTPAAADGD